MKPFTIRIDARGWIGVGVFLLVIMLLWMTAAFPELRQDEFFKTIATLVIGGAYVNGVVAWAYSATKQGGELADRAANLVEQHSAKGESATPASPAGGDELPDYARP